MRSLLPLWLLCLLLAGCHSTDPTIGTTTVSGQVVTYQTNQPVPNATVQVYHLSSGGGYVPVGTPFPADKQGHFAFDFNADNKFGYLLMASAPPGYITDWGTAPSLTAGRSNTDVLLPVLAPAWVRIQLVDEPPKSQVVVHTQGYEGSGDTFYYPKDTTVVRPLFAGSDSAVFWWIDEQGQIRSDNKHFQSKALDTVTVRIPF
ncbi:carboxypeptidase regulatory-like domain-containing protein [Hymenobacter baengnokdamensis]|uniref:carboxypeptidase regulatory-like domain-containing protein n=1 Tax=Hymenobacter baengnokdamensis TaxID=2615203 RepID=UPI001248DF8F|nr:carboxypeptidase regulatory-like domain-containing protein [Hymenobacter baengnokdamensis]